MSGLSPDPQGIADERAALYVAGAMTPDERSEFESSLNQDAELRSAVASYDSVCEALIDQINPVTPTETVLQSLLSRIDDAEANAEQARSDASGLVIHRADTADWEETDVPGVTQRVLNIDTKLKRMTVVMRLEPGVSVPAHAHDQDEECLMLEGDLDFGEYRLLAGDYLRMAAGTEHGIAHTRSGCVCLVITALPDALVA